MEKQEFTTWTAAALANTTTWLVGPGLRIALIVALAIVAYEAMHRSVPRILTVAVGRGMPGQSAEEVAKRAETLIYVVTRTIAAVIVITTLFMTLSELGVNIAPLLAGAGVVGIAIGFGAQQLVQDVLQGLFIILENQYGKGDVIKAAGIAGMVEEVNLRRTVLRDLDGTVHSIPNGEIRIVSNLTREFSRVNLNVSVGYGEDLDHVADVINRLGQQLAEDEYFGPLIVEPPKVLRVDDFEASGIAIKILGVTKAMKQWEVAGELRKRLKKAFDEEGIEIPWPHVVVHNRTPVASAKPKNGHGNGRADAEVGGQGPGARE